MRGDTSNKVTLEEESNLEETSNFEQKRFPIDTRSDLLASGRRYRPILQPPTLESTMQEKISNPTWATSPFGLYIPTRELEHLDLRTRSRLAVYGVEEVDLDDEDFQEAVSHRTKPYYQHL